MDTLPERMPDSVGPVLALAGSMLIAGCGAGGGDTAAASGTSAGGGSSTPPDTGHRITVLKLAATDAAPLTVNGVVGGPSGVSFLLDGGSGATHLASDAGVGTTSKDYAFSASSSAGSQQLTVTLDASPAAVMARSSSAVASTRTILATAGLPPTWDELMAASGLNRAQLVARLIGRMRGTPAEAYPVWIDDRILSSAEYRALSASERTAYDNRHYPRRQELKAWWLRQMVTSPDPLSERLLLFWHNLFTSSGSDLGPAELIARQHRLYRQQQTGNLRSFLKAMSRDPAMVIYLDSALNRKGSPNENFARELLELFTLGERTVLNGYDESDIPIVARCFTGYGLTANKEFQFVAKDHDTSARTLWGSAIAGNADDGDQVIDLILARRVGGRNVCATYLVQRLWREFIGDLSAADGAAIASLAEGFAADFELKPLYQALLTTPAASDPTRLGSRIRAPVELFVGFHRPLALAPDAWSEHIGTCANLEQDLLDPDNVFGWPGGTAWVNVKTVVDRRDALDRLGRKYRSKVPARLLPALDLLLLATAPVVTPGASTDAGLRARQLLIDPAYHLR